MTHCINNIGKRKILIFFYESFLSVSLVLLTSCTYIPMSYRITDVSMQRIMLDSDSDSANNMVYLLGAKLSTAKKKLLPSIYYGGLPPFPDGSIDSILNISIESQDGTCLNNNFISYNETDGTHPQSINLIGADTIRVYKNLSIDLFREILQRGPNWIKKTEVYCMLILDKSGAMPQIVHFVFSDRKLTRDVQETPMHYSVRNQ